MGLFSPLADSSNCTFFYLVSVLTFINFIIVLVMGFFKKIKNWPVYLFAVLSPLISYYMFRIFYSMCTASLK
jgi:uncharacterized membrane protein